MYLFFFISTWCAVYRILYFIWKGYATKIFVSTYVRVPHLERCYTQSHVYVYACCNHVVP